MTIAFFILALRPSPKHTFYMWCAIYVAAIAAASFGCFRKMPMMSLWPHLAFFAGGTALGLCHRLALVKDILPARSWNGFTVLLFSGFFILAAHPGFDVIDNRPDLEGSTLWFHATLITIIAFVLSNSSGFVEWLFSNRLARFFGKISFGIYLLHTYILHHLIKYFPPVALLNCALIFLATIAASWLSYELLEKPFIRWGSMLSLRLLVKRSPGRKKQRIKDRLLPTH